MKNKPYLKYIFTIVAIFCIILAIIIRLEIDGYQVLKKYSPEFTVNKVFSKKVFDIDPESIVSIRFSTMPDGEYISDRDEISRIIGFFNDFRCIFKTPKKSFITGGYPLKSATFISSNGETITFYIIINGVKIDDMQFSCLPSYFADFLEYIKKL